MYVFPSADVMMDQTHSPIAIPVFDPVLQGEDLRLGEIAAAQVDSPTGEIQMAARSEVTVYLSLSLRSSSNLGDDQVLPARAQQVIRQLQDDPPETSIHPVLGVKLLLQLGGFEHWSHSWVPQDRQGLNGGRVHHLLPTVHCGIARLGQPGLRCAGADETTWAMLCLC